MASYFCSVSTHLEFVAVAEAIEKFGRHRDVQIDGSQTGHLLLRHLPNFVDPRALTTIEKTHVWVNGADFVPCTDLESLKSCVKRHSAAWNQALKTWKDLCLDPKQTKVKFRVTAYRVGPKNSVAISRLNAARVVGEVLHDDVLPTADPRLHWAVDLSDYQVEITVQFRCFWLNKIKGMIPKNKEVAYKVNDASLFFVRESYSLSLLLLCLEQRQACSFRDPLAVRSWL